MTELRQLLAATPRRLLVVIARQRHVPFPRDAPKAALVDLLATSMSDPAQLCTVLDTLSDAEQAVLLDLSAAGGRLPRYHVTRRHGDLRPYRPWRPDASPRPWQNPISPVQRLYFLGLIFWDRPTDDLIIPADLLPFFPAPARPDRATPATVPLGSAHAAALDISLLLALLEVDDVRPLHGRWLTPRLLADWGQRCSVPPLHPTARGERQTGRRRLLHYLAEDAGFVAIAGRCLKPTPAAWNWLQAEPSSRLHALWEIFASPTDDLWRAYRLPGHDILHHPRVLVESALRALPHTVPSNPAAFAYALLGCDPEPHNDLHARLPDAEELLTQAILDLLTGPLVWLGALAIDNADRLSLTSWGTAWLGLSEPPAIPPPAPFSLGPDLTLTPPPGYPDPLALVTIETCAERLPDGRYQITPAALTRALHRGHAIAGLLDRLSRVADRPLTGQEQATLNQWSQTADQAIIRRLTVLETVDPEIIVRLSQSRRGRPIIRRTLSRRTVVVDEGKLPLLVRRLTRQEGIPPRVEIPSAAPPSSPALGRGGAAHLWLVARLYQKLGRFIPLPVHFPQSLLEHLAAVAEPGDMEAADAALEQALAALQDAIDGWAAFPAWGEPGLAVEETLPLIQQALEQGRALGMTYYTAGRNELTHRVVEPLRIEYRGQVPYLVGFCHLAQAERVFRLDRIRRIGMAKRSSDGGER